MQIWSKSSAATRQLSFLVFDDFSNHGLANLMEPFRAANTLLRRTAYAWDILTPDGADVTSSSGLLVKPTRQGTVTARGDMLFVVSSYGQERLATAKTCAQLRAFSQRFERLVSIDTASWLVASAGLLDAKRATIHFELLDRFSESFPDTQVERARWVDDGDMITCGGAMAGFDLACHLIGQDHGAALVLDIRRLFMSETATLPTDRARFSGDRVVDRCVMVMAAHLENPLGIHALAQQSGCTQRRLEQKFRAHFGASPSKVYRRLRLDEAKRLLERGGLSVAEVALRCGYGDQSAFARAFRLEFGQKPSEFRV